MRRLRRRQSTLFRATILGSVEGGGGAPPPPLGSGPDQDRPQWRNHSEVIAMANARHKEEHWVLQLTGAVGVSISLEMIARAVWQEPRSTVGGHYAINPSAQGAHVICDTAWKG